MQETKKAVPFLGKRLLYFCAVETHGRASLQKLQFVFLLPFGGC